MRVWFVRLLDWFHSLFKFNIIVSTAFTVIPLKPIEQYVAPVISEYASDTKYLKHV